MSQAHETEKATRIMRTTMKAGMAGLTLVLSLGLITGCGAISEIRDVIPEVSVDDNGDGGSVTLKGDDGESVTIDTTTDGEIPGWFPSELPLPESYTVVSSSDAEYGDESLKSVALTTPDDFDAVIATLDEGLAASGLTAETRQVNDLSSMSTAMFGVTVAGEGWMINILDYGDEMGEDLRVTYATVKEGE